MHPFLPLAWNLPKPCVGLLRSREFLFALQSGVFRASPLTDASTSSFRPRGLFAAPQDSPALCPRSGVGLEAWQGGRA